MLFVVQRLRYIKAERRKMRVCILAGVLALAQVRWRPHDASIMQYTAIV